MSATKRILQDYRGIIEDPIKGVHIGIPRERNIKLWHINFVFPQTHEFYPGLILHAKVQFGVNFPNEPPLVSLFTKFYHSHVFNGKEICFSLQNNFRQYFNETRTHHSAFWNPLRTTKDLLAGIYNMLLFDVDKHVDLTPEKTDECFQRAGSFNCRICPHQGNGIPWPMNDYKEQVEEVQEVRPAENHAVQPCAAPNVPEKSGEKCGGGDLSLYSCPFTNKNISDENIVLGFGVRTTQHHLLSDFELLSYEAFKGMGIRTSAYGFEFDKFVPIFINKDHWERAVGLFWEFDESIKASVEEQIDPIQSDLKQLCSIRRLLTGAINKFYMDGVVSDKVMRGIHWIMELFVHYVNGFEIIRKIHELASFHHTYMVKMIDMCLCFVVAKEGDPTNKIEMNRFCRTQLTRIFRALVERFKFIEFPGFLLMSENVIKQRFWRLLALNLFPTYALVLFALEWRLVGPNEEAKRKFARLIKCETVEELVDIFGLDPVKDRNYFEICAGCFVGSCQIKNGTSFTTHNTPLLPPPTSSSSSSSNLNPNHNGNQSN